MKRIILFLSIATASGLVMVTVYNTVIDAASWNADIPTSIEVARAYYQHVDPRRFFLMLGPPNFVLAALTLVLYWRSIASRTYFGAALILYAAVVVLTFTYFIPRDLILFTSPISEHLDDIRAAASQWQRMNWMRTLVGSAGVWCSFKGLDALSRNPRQRQNTLRPQRAEDADAATQRQDDQ